MFVKSKWRGVFIFLTGRVLLVGVARALDLLLDEPRAVLVARKLGHVPGDDQFQVRTVAQRIGERLDEVLLSLYRVDGREIQEHVVVGVEPEGPARGGAGGRIEVEFFDVDAVGDDDGLGLHFGSDRDAWRGLRVWIWEYAWPG